MRIYGWTRKTGGVAHYRIHEPLRALALRGHQITTGNELDLRTIRDFDVIIMSVVGDNEASEGWEKLATLPGRPKMVYDIDDDVWNWRPGLKQYEYWEGPDGEEALRNVQSGIACADAVITPSAVLADRLYELNGNMHVIENYVPEWLTRLPVRRPDRFTIGYQGGDTHRFDIQHVLPGVIRFLGMNQRTRLSLWGVDKYEGIFSDRVTHHPWTRNVNAYYRSLTMSVGLAPLENIPFNRAKSNIKLKEYMALGIPYIASAGMPMYEELHDAYPGGDLIPTYRESKPTHQNWYAALNRAYSWYKHAHDGYGYIENSMQSVRNHMRRHHTVEGNAYRWETVFNG